MRIIRINHPHQFQIIGRGGKFFMDRLWGGLEYRRAITNYTTWANFRDSWKDQAADFEDRVERYRLY